jgi:hypothetical protein
MMAELKKFGVGASLIGRMTEGQPTRVRVL